MTTTRRTCSVDGCDRPYLAKNLCGLHWGRVNRLGSVDLAGGRRPGIVKGKVPQDVNVRFWRNVDKSGDCWVWTAGTNAWGYGMFNVHTPKGWRPQIASRFSYELANGPIDSEHIVRHKCDNPPCVNPDHLELGTHLDNMQDMRERGRSVSGSRHPMARFTEEEVAEIRRRLTLGESRSSIARSLHASPGTIDKIANGVTWTKEAS